MKASFSELSYAYALTENLVHHSGSTLVSAPTFPSTSDEGKKGGGYDLKLTFPGMCMFLQFKLSHYMSYGSAKEFTSGKFLHHVGGTKMPVYRMYLHALSKSRQTSLMLNLEKRHQLVYYVAPLFHLPTSLTKHYFDRRVAEESRFLRPSIIKKMPDLREHFVSFRKFGNPWRFSDDPVELEGVATQADIVESVRASLKRQAPAKEVLHSCLAAMLETLDEEASDASTLASRRLKSQANDLRQLDLPILPKAEFIARTFFDSSLLTFVNDSA